MSELEKKTCFRYSEPTSFAVIEARWTRSKAGWTIAPKTKHRWSIQNSDKHVEQTQFVVPKSYKVPQSWNLISILGRKNNVKESFLDFTWQPHSFVVCTERHRTAKTCSFCMSCLELSSSSPHSFESETCFFCWYKSTYIILYIYIKISCVSLYFVHFSCLNPKKILGESRCLVVGMPSHGGPEIMVVVPRQTRLSDPAEGIESIAAALNLELDINLPSDFRCF